ncbi:sugar phosphate isomerase/epimerase [Emticicia sp. C21]|uniref:sugar phosphate isomerase/epimerase family protein n=1 Tax=Emticicia sp. C21 TaxID=2302915 RepID=UPI000E35164A|nr:sugar phosphate isomerase/epimerase family protein [Emticicia sp. C21]RFS14337.1 sugar phosphate isomerase/epimerase [Emticicia sp. C21]
METNAISRRNLLKNSLAVGAGLGLGLPEAMAGSEKKAAHNFKFSLNTSTIREQNLGLMGEIETAAKAGYDAIEVWVSTVEKYVQQGGKLKDVKKKAADLGITIEDAIGFSKWIVDDATEREKALEQNKKEMAMLAEIGCKRIAAPPFGATTGKVLDLKAIAERYGKLLEVSDNFGVIPQLEMWGFSTNLHLVGEVLFAASESGHPKACVLTDVYHLHKGGSNFNSLRTASGSSIQMFHMNDYPGVPPRETINDGDRILPGDGVAPITQILKELHAKKTPIILSLEIFNKEYWKMDALVAAKLGIEKMKSSVAKAIA